MEAIWRPRFSLLIMGLALWHSVQSCRLGSDELKSYAQSSIESLFDGEALNSIYWPDEPMDPSMLSRATGLNITMIETRFQLVNDYPESSNGLLREIFFTCSLDRDRSYALFINLEIDNPFKTIAVSYEVPPIASKENRDEQKLSKRSGDIRSSATSKAETNRRHGQFNIKLPDSTFLVKLSQRIRYDECMVVEYVQLSPSVNYEIECIDCNSNEQSYLNNVLNKRMNQFDSELESMLSEKFLLGLQLMLSQQRLDLELFID